MIDTIFRRRSIRKYSGEPLSDDLLRDIVRAGMSAPSAGNEQPWHFIIINERQVLDAIPRVHPYAQMCATAPAAILVCGDTEREKHKGFWVQDCSAATENILLAATGLGLGSVWLGVHPREDRVAGLRQLLGIPVHVIPFSLIPVGHAAEEKPARTEFDFSRVRYNVW